MKTLIIAAGDGTRLNPLTLTQPKSLIKIGGLALIERVILTLKKVGLTDLVIVVGYFGDKIINYLGEGRKYGVKITYVKNNQWERGNGLSVYLAKKYLTEPFFMVMADHIFDWRIMEEFKKQTLNNEILKLAVDTKKKPVKGDMRVVVNKKNNIVDIGKTLKRWNAIDTGIFLCSPKVFSYFKKNIEKGKEEIFFTVREIARKNKATVWDFYQYFSEKNISLSALRKKIDLWWVDVDNFEDIKKLENKLSEIISKDPSDLLACYLHQPIENKISFFIANFPLTPFHITFVVNILAWIIFFLFLSGNLFLGSILSFLLGVLDGVDGKIARLKLMETNRGKLEHILDFVFETSWILALGFYFNQLLQANIIIILTAAYRMIYDLFSKTKKISLDMVNSFSKKFRRVASRRNLWNLLFFLLLILKKPNWYLPIVVFWTTMTFLVYFYLAYKYLDKKIDE